MLEHVIEGRLGTVPGSPIRDGDRRNSCDVRTPSRVGGYVSCIRIDGEPILAPVIADDRHRLELRLYREKAVQIERARTGTRADAKTGRVQSPSTLPPTLPSSTPSQAGRSPSTGAALHHDASRRSLHGPGSTNDASTAGSSSSSREWHQESSELKRGKGKDKERENGMEKERLCMDLKKVPSLVSLSDSTDHSSEATVRSAITNVKPGVQLSACLLDVTEFGQEGFFQVVHQPSYDCGKAHVSSRLDHVPCEMTITSSISAGSPVTDSLMLTPSHPADQERSSDEGSPESGPGRLVRCGSYTLENPSPVLLAHLERQSRTVLEKLESSKRTTTSSVTTAAASFSTACSEHDLHTCDTDNREDDDTFLDALCASTDTHLHLPDDILGNFSHDLQTRDALGESVDVHTLMDYRPDTDTGSQVEMLEEPRRSFTFKEGAQEEVGEELPAEQRTTATSDVDDEDDDEEGEGEGEGGSAPMSSSVPRQEAGAETREEEVEGGAQLEMIRALLIRQHHGGEQNELFFSTVEERRVQQQQRGHCRVMEMLSRVRTVERAEDGSAVRERRAAAALTAAVRGYLTRRLLRTERVQSLIRTIQEAVVCAVQLHSLRQPERADVDLHRRLIQQVSAACCAFHDVFFRLTVPEQMALIAADRRRLRDKGRSAGGRAGAGAGPHLLLGADTA